MILTYMETQMPQIWRTHNSQKLEIIALYSSDAEYVATAATACELINLKGILKYFMFVKIQFFIMIMKVIKIQKV